MSPEQVPNSSKICKLLFLKDKTGYEGVWNYSHSIVPGGFELMS